MMKLENGNYIRPSARFTWWLRQERYFNYMMRELSSLFIGIFSITLIWGLYRLSQGEIAFITWINAVWNYSIVLSVVTLLFAVYHSYTWFIVTPKAMPLKLAGKRVPAAVIAGAHLLLWLLCTIFTLVAFVYGGEA